MSKFDNDGYIIERTNAADMIGKKITAIFLEVVNGRTQVVLVSGKVRLMAINSNQFFDGDGNYFDLSEINFRP